MNEDDDDDDENDNSDENDSDSNSDENTKESATPNRQKSAASNPQQQPQQQQQQQQQQPLTSNLLHTSSANDPVLLTHAKCLNEDILCSWKRIQQPVSANGGSRGAGAGKKAQQNHNRKKSDDENEEDDDDDDEDEDEDENEAEKHHDGHSHQNNETDADNETNQIELNKLNDLKHKKELWIFWYEKEEPPNLRNIISADLVAVDPQTNAINQPSAQQQQPNTASDINKTLSMAAYSSHNGLPYESRSMLFKALHNLIEKSLLEKGYARLGKWFVMPYNLNNINYSCSMLNNNFSSLNPLNFLGASGIAGLSAGLASGVSASLAGGPTGGAGVGGLNSQNDLMIGDLNDVLSPSPNSNDTSSMGGGGATASNGPGSNAAGKCFVFHYI